MKLFVYTARTQDGQKKTGKILAGSEQQAAQALIDKNLIPVQLVAGKQPRNNRAMMWSKRVDIIELIGFLRNMYYLLKQGTPISEALDSVIASVRQRALKKALQKVQQSLLSGNSLSQAMAENPKFFSPFVVAILHAAEKRGELELGFYNLYQDINQDYKISKLTRSALLMPGLGIVAALSLVFIIVYYLVPLMIPFFTEQDLDLPMTTKVLISVSNFVTNNSSYIFLAFLWLLFIYFVLSSLPAVRLRIDWLKYKIPIIGKIALCRALLRFNRYVSLLLSEQLPVDEVLLLAAPSVRNAWLQNKISQIGSLLRQGIGLHQAFVAAKAFPAVMLMALKTGEKTDTLQYSFRELADMFAFSTQEKLDMISQLARPIFIVIMLAVALLVIMGLYQPMLLLVQQSISNI